MTSEEMNNRLHSHACSCHLKASEAVEAHEKAVERRERTEKMHTGAPPEHMAKILAGLDAEIEGHEARNAVMHRRAEHADGGWLISSPDEQTDADYQREHHELISEMTKAGRVRYVKDRA